jgi:hypothetical protein
MVGTTAAVAAGAVAVEAASPSRESVPEMLGGILLAEL